MVELRPIQGRHLSQYFGLWLVDPSRFLTFFECLQRTGFVVQSEYSGGGLQAQGNGGTSRADKDVTIGLINITGVLTKTLGWFSDSDDSSTIQARRNIREAVTREDIDGIILRIDSPGGSVAGIADLGKEVAEANKVKPVFAFIEDLGASAAYWVASQAERVIANDTTALVGSIGTFVGLYDLSGLAEKEGIKPIVIRSGEFKGAAFPGVEITDEFQATLQELVDKTQAEFNKAVSKGRGLPAKEVKALADGRVHMAKDAKELGLIDGIQSLDKVIADLSALCKKQRRGHAAAQVQESTVMAFKPESNTATDSGAGVEPSADVRVQVEVGATAEEIEQACIGADPAFVLDQLKRKATVAEAVHSWVKIQDEQLEEERQARQAAEEKVTVSAAEMPGIDGLGEAGNLSPVTIDDPVSQWKEAVAAKIKAGLDQPKAIRAVVVEQPELQQAYIEVVNAKR